MPDFPINVPIEAQGAISGAQQITDALGGIKGATDEITEGIGKVTKSISNIAKAGGIFAAVGAVKALVGAVIDLGNWLADTEARAEAYRETLRKEIDAQQKLTDIIDASLTTRERERRDLEQMIVVTEEMIRVRGREGEAADALEDALRRLEARRASEGDVARAAVAAAEARLALQATQGDRVRALDEERAQALAEIDRTLGVLADEAQEKANKALAELERARGASATVAEFFAAKAEAASAVEEMERTLTVYIGTLDETNIEMDRLIKTEKQLRFDEAKRGADDAADSLEALRKQYNALLGSLDENVRKAQEAEQVHALLTALFEREGITADEVRETWDAYTASIAAAAAAQRAADFSEIASDLEALRKAAGDLNTEAERRTALIPTALADLEKDVELAGMTVDKREEEVIILQLRNELLREGVKLDTESERKARDLVRARQAATDAQEKNNEQQSTMLQVLRETHSEFVDAAADADLEWDKFWRDFLTNIQKSIVASLLLQASGGGGGGGGVGALLLGAQHGAQWEVGGQAGADRNVISFAASRGETITVTPAGQPAGGGFGGEPPVVNNKFILVGNMEEAALEAQRSPAGERVTIETMSKNRRSLPRLF